MEILGSEEWRPIPGYVGYEASSLGRIRSVDRVIQTRQGPKRIRGRVLAAHPAYNEYLHVSLGRDTGNKTVHRLVCTAFHGEPEDGEVARHLNDQKQDNRPENLAWGTLSENMLDARRNGTWSNQFVGMTHCVHGHELAGENLVLTDGGTKRRCRQCLRLRARRYQDKNREAVRKRWREYARRKRAENAAA